MSHKVLRLVTSLLLALAVTAIASGPQPARAAGTWYVAPSGDDNNACLSPATTCATINGAIGKASSGDTILVSVGPYIGTGDQVVLIDKSLTLSGGWDASFITQGGMSTIDGQGARQGILVNNGTTVIVDHFTVQNGFSNLNGGGIYTEGELTLDNSVVTSSTAPQYGGGISSWGIGALTISNSIISGNTAGGGGGIAAVGGTLITLNNSSVINNHSYNGAGIWTGQNLILNNSTIKDNTASENGGGIFIYVTNSMTLNNSTITGNQALNGGGILLSNYSSGGGPQETTILNSTVSNNTAQAGGGITMEYSFPDRVVAVRNSIIAQNTASSAADCSGSIGTSDHNIIGSTSGCTVTSGSGDQFNINPLISASAIGAPAYHFLLAGSPAINAGDSCLSTDQRGVARPQGAACDIGSYEKTTPGAAVSFGILSGSNQRIAPLTSFAPLSVYVVDNIGTPVDGVNVTFTAPASGPSGIFSGSGTNSNTVSTDINGIATASTFTANSQLGSYDVNATASGLPGSVNFALANVAWYVSPSGDDSNNCATSGTPCLTINGAIGKAVAGDTIKVAVGTYTGSGTEVVLVNKSVTLSGGWNASFTTQSGTSTIDGQNVYLGAFLDNGNVTASLDHFIVKNASIGILNYGNLTVNNSSIQNNNYGGIYNTGTLTLNNTTVSNNSTPSNAGGITNSAGNVTLNNVTISNNTGDSAGGILNTGSVSINNSIVALNSYTSAFYPNPDCAGTLTSNGNNIIGDISGCTVTAVSGDQFNTNPMLGPFLSAQGYYPLLPGSPAINAGNPATCLPSDQRGVARVGVCDIGSYEFAVPGSAASLVVISGSNQRATPMFAFLNPLKAIALDSAGTPVPNVNVTFTAPGSGASGTFTSTGTNTMSVLTDTGGIATTSAFTANGQLGAYVVTASASGAGSVNFNLENAAWYVSSSGNDSNSCSLPASPCLTINGTMGKAFSGETIFVATGTYTDSSGYQVVRIEKNIILSGGWNGTFTIRNGTSIIDGQNARTGVWVLQNVNATMNGFSIRDGGNTGIYVSGSLILNNSTVSGNNGQFGGGIFVDSGSLIAQNVTIANNNAAQGGGLQNNYGTVTLRNSILANNTTSAGGPDCYGLINISDHNIIGNTSGCAVTQGIGDLFNVNPGLGTFIQGYYPLLLGSPAIDAGNPSTCLATDQRGVARPQGARCDIGAFELEATGGVEEVTIDIKPGSQSNPINPKSLGTIPVAILSTLGFNAPSEVDKTSLTFGRTGDEASLVSCNKGGEDVSGDGLLDLVCRFKIKLTGFQIGDTVGFLKGQTVNGIPIEGQDRVRILK